MFTTRPIDAIDAIDARAALSVESMMALGAGVGLAV